MNKNLIAAVVGIIASCAVECWAEGWGRPVVLTPATNATIAVWTNTIDGATLKYVLIDPTGTSNMTYYVDAKIANGQHTFRIQTGLSSLAGSNVAPVELDFPLSDRDLVTVSTSTEYNSTTNQVILLLRDPGKDH